MLDKLTVVITTHNRHHLLENRVLPHFLEFGIHLVVVDSSAEPHRWSMDNPGVDYVHCPNEPLPHKLVKPVLERVTTPYMLLHPDDTLTSKRAAIKCLEFLEANPDFSAADGLVLQCHHDDKQRISTRNLQRSLLQADSDRPGERIFQHFMLFEPTYYSVQRTACWHNIMRRMPKEIVNYYLTDTFVAMMTVIHGKRATLPIFYQATEAGPSINEKDLRYMCSPFKLATDSRYAVEVAAVRRATTDYLMETAGIPENVAKLYIEGGLALYWLQDKPIKSFGDRLRNEWQSFLNKTVHKSRVRRRRVEKRAAAIECENRDREEVLASLGEEDLDEFRRLMRIVQTTYM